MVAGVGARWNGYRPDDLPLAPYANSPYNAANA